MPRLHASLAAYRVTVFPYNEEDHAVAEIENLLDLVMVVFPICPPAVKELTDRRPALEASKTQIGQIPHGVEREEARQRIEVPVAVHGLKETARPLQVRGRGLVRHRREQADGARMPAASSRRGCFSERQRLPKAGELRRGWPALPTAAKAARSMRACAAMAPNAGATRPRPIAAPTSGVSLVETPVDWMIADGTPIAQTASAREGDLGRSALKTGARKGRRALATTPTAKTDAMKGAPAGTPVMRRTISLKILYARYRPPKSSWGLLILGGCVVGIIRWYSRARRPGLGSAPWPRGKPPYWWVENHLRRIASNTLESPGRSGMRRERSSPRLLARGPELETTTFASCLDRGPYCA